MKKNIFIAFVVITFVVILVYLRIQPERSYISFEHECLEVDGQISEIADRTVAEFPECMIITSGNFMDSDFVFVRCGNNALNTSNFITFRKRAACETFTGLDTDQQKRIISSQ